MKTIVSLQETINSLRLHQDSNPRPEKEQEASIPHYTTMPQIIAYSDWSIDSFKVFMSSFITVPKSYQES